MTQPYFIVKAHTVNFDGTEGGQLMSVYTTEALAMAVANGYQSYTDNAFDLCIGLDSAFEYIEEMGIKLNRFNGNVVKFYVKELQEV